MPAPRRDYFVVPGGMTSMPQVRGLSDTVFRSWIELLDAAAAQKEPGRFRDVRSASAVIRRPIAHLMQLLDAGLVVECSDHLAVRNWDDWQGRPSPMRVEWNNMRRTTAPDIYLRDGSKCVLCGTTTDLSVDHVLPLARGGTNDLANLRTLCRPCNSRKGAV